MKSETINLTPSVILILDTVKLQDSATRSQVSKKLATEVIKEAVDYLEQLLTLIELSPGHKSQYISSFSFDKQNEAVTVKFKGKNELISAIEEGAPGFDMKRILLDHNAKISKDGHRYRVIPIDSDQPSYNISKADVLAGNFPEVTGIKIDKKSSPNYRIHGLERSQTVTIEERTTENTVESRYTRFRTVSDSPNSSSGWHHPGFHGFRILEKLTQYIEATFDSIEKMVTYDMLEIISQDEALFA